MIMSTTTKFNSNDIWELKNKEWQQNIDYVKETLTPRTLAYLVPILDMGREQCKSIINLNKDFYSSPYFSNLRTDILTFSIMRSFDEKYLPRNFPYKVEPTIINRVNKYVVPMLNIGNIDINILKAYGRNRVSNKNRNYLKQRCEGNVQLRGQLDLFNDSSKTSRLHGVITYNIDKNWERYKFIDLTFFDPNLKEVIVKVDLLKTLQIYDGGNGDNSKQSLVNVEDLRKDIQKEFDELIIK